MKWLKEHSKGTLLLLYIRPGASRTQVSGEHDGRLKIQIKAPPRDGEANASLIDFLSEFLKLPKSRIQLVQGESSRQKTVLVELSLEDMRKFTFL
jgi:uncharacterized protein (TIGR00251 family)